MAREHLRAFADVSGVEIVGIHSRTRARAESLAAEHGLPHVCGSVAELYETTRADLVVVAVPELVMNAVSRETFRYPWTILLEKPAGYSLADAEEIRAEAHRSGRRVYVALNRRHYASTRAVLQDVEGMAGPRFIVVQDQQDLAQARSLGHPPAVVQNWMYANSIHVIDYLRVFGRGTVTRVAPILPWTPESPGVVVCRIEFSGGDVGLYEGIWNGPGPWAVTVTTAAKRWELRPLERAAFQARGDRQLHALEPDPRDVAFKPGLRVQAEQAVRAAMDQATTLPPIADAFETMQLVHAIFQVPSTLSSSHTGASHGH
jgi:predicted dehydrogenase